MRQTKLRKQERPKYEPKENQQSQNIGNRDIPLGGPTTVTDTTSYGRLGKLGELQMKQEKQAKEEPKKTNLERKSDSSGRQ